MFSDIECDLPLRPALCVEMCKQDFIDLVEEELLFRKYDKAKKGKCELRDLMNLFAGTLACSMNWRLNFGPPGKLNGFITGVVA